MIYFLCILHRLAFILCIKFECRWHIHECWWTFAIYLLYTDVKWYKKHKQCPLQEKEINADKTYRNEIPLQPGFILHRIEASHVLPLLIHLAVVDVRVLRGGVISPDDHILHKLCWNATTHCHLEDTLYSTTRLLLLLSPIQSCHTVAKLIHEQKP